MPMHQTWKEDVDIAGSMGRDILMEVMAQSVSQLNGPRKGGPLRSSNDRHGVAIPSYQGANNSRRWGLKSTREAGKDLNDLPTYYAQRDNQEQSIHCTHHLVLLCWSFHSSALLFSIVFCPLNPSTKFHESEHVTFSSCMPRAACPSSQPWAGSSYGSCTLRR
jgi:hypothetical protein